MSNNINSSLIFNPDEDENYCAWKNDVKVWPVFTMEEPKQQGEQYISP